MGDGTFLFREFLRCPLQVGAVLPSSPSLAAVAARTVPEHGDPVVVELGPGTGPITKAVQERLGERGRHVAVEVNPRLAESLERRWPRVTVVHGNAVRLPEILTRRGLTADAVISSLPWASFGGELQDKLLAATLNALGDDGVFSAFAYIHARLMPSAVRFRRRLDASFSEVEVSPVVWRNAPPAVVYFCRRPRHGGR
ncbi:SAM-dependent methyltransferase [Actinomadura spongiicola]|uniref:SAM-dependent methyltransferase n=1 Tax=Actinomadura spongiicola TaxID=2303421 RepID=A0A372GG97_9ACTN|nr:rRNA adenine N-6-methyltransferase family protein [Actinomadura spongiicola]RFS84109.1 SAM-dependent methyltransferase [Actinomadura spongiicola]